MPADPRTHITPDAFSVAPELLGYALATPKRRLFAIVIDLGCAALIARTGIGFLIAAAAALLAWRTLGGPADRLLARRARLVFRAASAILALFIVINLWRAAAGKLRSLEDTDSHRAATPDVQASLEDLGLGKGDQALFMVRFAALEVADEEAGRLGGELARWLRERAAPGKAREQFAASLAEAMKPEAKAAFLRELGNPAAAPDTAAADTSPVATPGGGLGATAAAPPPDSAATPPAANPGALADSASPDSARPALGAAPDSMELLVQANQELLDQNARLRERLEEGGKKRGFRAWLGEISDDLGLGFGWFALYFTAFTVLGRGQTPGKRLLGIKVLRLDNRPISWWQAFERFGGYAASFSTGLLGFAQILWDRNRQALHDKAVETVVIRLEGGQPIKLT